MEFPLLKLPYLCIKSIIQNSDPLNLIELTRRSRRFSRLVKSIRTRVTSISVWPFGEARLKLEPFEGYYFMKPTDSLSTVVPELKTLFKCSVGEVNIESDYLPKVDSPWDLDLGPSKCKKLKIKGNQEIDQNLLTNIIKVMAVSNCLCLDVPIPKSFYYCPELIDSKEVIFYKKSARWIDSSTLLKFNCSRICLDGGMLRIEDAVALVTQWFYSDDHDFEFLLLNFDSPPEELNIEHLNPMEFCESRRSRVLKYSQDGMIDLSEGLDIIRKDGLLATLLIKHTAFLFYVWHRRFLDD